MLLTALTVLSTLAAGDFATSDVKKVLDHRCIACHSCYDAPCQLNLQSLDGALRGAHRLNVYDGTRTTAATPTRMFEDALTTAAWREKGFQDVLGTPESSLLLRMVDLADKRKTRPTVNVRDNQLCVANEPEMKALERDHAEFAMPYGLPPLTKLERDVLAKWVAAPSRGTPEPLGLSRLPPAARKLARAWESFLNDKDLRHRIVARYLYEHFFLASFEAAEAPGEVLKLARSSTTCDKAVTPVATRWSNDAPGVDNWSYCFYRDPATPVFKKHIPYEMSARKLAWLEKLFFTDLWEAKEFPSFERAKAANPFVTFRAIPVPLRYRFLLEDAQYHVNTFIKGPVCDGNVAVNSIRDQFYMFFMAPDADTMAKHRDSAAELEDLLVLPGNLDAANDLVKIGSDYSKLVALRTKYRDMHNAQIKQYFPAGIPLDAIWDGDGRNRNAVLTVFRHFDNAAVVQGARGDLPRTVWVVDYSILERLSYNLVVNFDVFGTIKHQGLTRLYMDLLRMEAEDNYLELLPKEVRLKLKESWYTGLPTALQLHLLRETELADVPGAIPLKAKADPHRELTRALLFSRLPAPARGADDTINWKVVHPARAPHDKVDAALRRIAAIKSVPSAPFARFFPNLTLLLVTGAAGRPPRVYSLIHDRELENVAWMFLEDLRVDETGSSLTVARGVLGGYPNQLLVVSEDGADDFAKQVFDIQSQADYAKLLARFGVDRMSPSFWSYYDAVQAVEPAWVDLSRYAL